MACMGRTSRSRRPCARGEVLCTEPGKSHPCPDRQAGPVHEGNSRTMNMHADENSDGVIVPEKRPNKEDLHDKVHRGSYRARPARRTYIPKADGSKRPLSILCLEDKIVQQAVATVLEAIYEEDFLGFSYGFRPGRGQHDALDALHAGILRKQVSWVLDADIRGFLDTASYCPLVHEV